MSERSKTVSRLLSDLDARVSYIRAKLTILVPSQIKALRLKSGMSRQSDLAREAGMHQSRISMFEMPGASNMTIDTLSRLAATFKTGLIIEFVPFSEMLEWENKFNQDLFDVVRIDKDADFIRAAGKPGEGRGNLTDELKRTLAILVFLAVSGWGLLICQVVKQHQRSEVVRDWAEEAYNVGRSDCHYVSEEVSASNRKFMAETVVKAHEGAWDRW
jgi:transcriptional regulator with XRE-family HTH domain